MPNEPVEKVTFLKSASSAGSKITNYCLSPKVFGCGNRTGHNFWKGENWGQIFIFDFTFSLF
jgi:hypothetical protein